MPVEMGNEQGFSGRIPFFENSVTLLFRSTNGASTNGASMWGLPYMAKNKIRL